MARGADSLGRTSRFPAFAVSLLVVAALGCWWPVVQHHRLEARLAAAASTIARLPVTVHCQTIGEAFVDVGGESGWVAYGPDGVPEPHALLKRDICGDLASFPDAGPASLDQVVAVHVLTHEAMHMRGETQESAAECQAMQRDAAMARALGASPAVAAELARRYWRQVYPSLPQDYVSQACGPTGTMDELLADPPWADAPAGP